jgi:hypothetical protein
MIFKSVFIIAITVICLGLIGLSPIVYAEEYAAGHVIESRQSFAENVKFGAGVDFQAAQTFPAGTFFSGAHEFTGDTVHQFTGNGIIFGDGSGITFQSGKTFGKYADFSAGLLKIGNTPGEVAGTSTFGEGAMFTDEQPFVDTQNFAKYNYFGDKTDFTGASQTFKEGMVFGPGSIFRTNQVLPVGTIPSQGIIMNAVTCPDTSCVPDPADVIAPGEKFGAGIDPAAAKKYVRSDDKTFEIDGLGLTMTFDTVSTDGNIKADLLDPATVAGATLSGTTLTMAGLGASVGNVIDLSADTASITGDIVVTLPYQDSEADDENNLTMYHYVNSEWIEEQNCTTDTTANTVTCTVTSLSPFSVGSKSGSVGATSTNTSAGSACNDKALDGKSLRLYQIRYDLCESSTIEILGYSTCGPLQYTVKDESGLNKGKVNIVQNFINQTKLSMIADVSENSDSYKIEIQNHVQDIRYVLIPEKLHGELLICSGTTILEQFDGDHTGYTSEQQGNQFRKTSTDITVESTQPEPIMFELESKYIPEPKYTPEPIDKFFLLNWLEEIFYQIRT